jgi:hypothetical protein
MLYEACMCVGLTLLLFISIALVMIWRTIRVTPSAPALKQRCQFNTDCGDGLQCSYGVCMVGGADTMIKTKGDVTPLTDVILARGFRNAPPPVHVSPPNRSYVPPPVPPPVNFPPPMNISPTMNVSPANRSYVPPMNVSPPNRSYVPPMNIPSYVPQVCSQGCPPTAPPLTACPEPSKQSWVKQYAQTITPAKQAAQIPAPPLFIIHSDNSEVETSNEFSHGTEDLGDFDVLSASTAQHSWDASPPLRAVECPRETKEEITAQMINNPSAIDVTSYSDAILFLVKCGDIVRTSNGKTIHTKNNIVLSRIFPFAGYLHGLSHGTLYELDMLTYATDKWTWVPCSWAVLGIHHLSATSDGNYLWLQTISRGLLYDKNRKVITELTMETKRIYGHTNTIFMDINTKTDEALVNDDGKEYTVTDIHDGIIDYYGKVVPAETGTVVRLVNWKPMIVRQHPH